MQRTLIVVGCQRSKLEKVPAKYKTRLIDYIHRNECMYMSTIAVIRRNMFGNDNFRRSGDAIMSSGLEIYDFEVDEVIDVPGYVIEVNRLRKDVCYDICGISAGASVIAIAYTLYSYGFKVRILSDLIEDRFGETVKKEALHLMETYMPGCVV